MIKRGFDFIISLMLLVMLCPLILGLALLVRLVMGAPVFFTQQRLGLNGLTFSLVKFRTMKNELDDLHNPLPDKDRLSALGQFMRRTSLDELPELWNVLKGDMSLVGPRPLLVEYLPLYSPDQMRRHETRPGITGWAQVNGRNAIPWGDKFKMDVWYVDNQSFLLDCQILGLTLKTVLQGDGISHPGEATMSRFTGSER